MNESAPISTNQTSTRSRYSGTRPFTDSPEDQQRFCGRNMESEELYLRVVSVYLLVLFAKSGLGKTSLLQASLFPRLRQKPFLPVMVRLNDTKESLVDAVARSIEQSCKTEGLKLRKVRRDGLWELLSTALAWRGDLLLSPVLIFDQFEEVFTLRDKAFRDGLAEELGALAVGLAPKRLWPQDGRAPERFSARPDVKIVISLREDYLAALEEFTPAVPNLFRERLRLEPLTEEGAREAITKPAGLEAKAGEAPFRAPRFEFETSALDEMIVYLQGKSGVIEGFALQLLCGQAEALACRKGENGQGLVCLTLADFKEGKDFEQVLKNFYRDALGKVAQELGEAARANAEELCEHGLLDREGHRSLLLGAQIRRRYGVDDQILEVFLQERLVRRERRQESVFYELSHDRLAESVYASRRNKLSKKELERIEKEKEQIKKEQEQKQWEEEQRLKEIEQEQLHRDIEQRLKEQEQLLKEQEQIQREKEQIFREQAQSQKEREQLQKEREQRLKEQQLKRQRYRWAIGAPVFALLGASATSWCFLTVEKAINVATQLSVAGNDATPLGDRLLALVSASKSSESVGVRIALRFAFDTQAKEATELLREILKRSPIFGGSGPAALNSDGTRLAYLSVPDANKASVITLDLPKDIRDASDLDLNGLVSSSKAIDVPMGNVVGAVTLGVSPAAPTIGFVMDRASNPTSEAVVVSPSKLSVLAGIMPQKSNPGPSCADSWDDKNFENAPSPTRADQNRALLITPTGAVTREIPLGSFGRGLFPPQVEFGNDSLRVTSLSFGNGGAPITLCVLPIQPTHTKSSDGSESPDVTLKKANDRFPAQINWDPIGRRARRIPVFASDCDKFAVLGSPLPENGNAVQAELANLTLYADDFLGAADTHIDVGLPSGARQSSSVAILRGCSRAVVRAGDTISLFKFNQDGKFENGSHYDIPDSLKGGLVAPWLYSSALAGAPVANPKAVRVAWLLQRGLAVIDLHEDSTVAPLLGGQAFLTGFADPPSVTRLTISRDGRFLLVSSQKDFNAVPEIRLFDLGEERLNLIDNLRGKQLQEVACRTARYLPSSAMNNRVCTS